MASDGSSPVSIPEDIAHIIVRHLADHYKWQSTGFVPSKHWTNVKGVSKAFYKAVHQIISDIVLVAVFQDYEEYGVCFAYRNALPDGAVFREKRRMVSYLKFIAAHVNRPVCLDIKGYYKHEPNDEIIHTLCTFRADVTHKCCSINWAQFPRHYSAAFFICNTMLQAYREVNGAILRRPCSCPACNRLIYRARPVPPMYTEPEEDSEEDSDEWDEY
ncbi:hypothetical protein Y032_0065g3655 [Ancylostoma ceylanicum]|uniref:Uncharacterized protein n=1 Tax=Ancylostoma ceylanicum TaxID=53326 RepID=A0A016U011_9BILA|nr:hypothetical protein Y032_0065g3655 [Ancylostoma ceylanicum]